MILYLGIKYSVENVILKKPKKLNKQKIFPCKKI